VSRDFDNRLTARQEAALRSIAASHPRPVTSAQLASELQIAEGSLNVTLRSLHRRGLIAATAPATARRRGGWTLEQS
jgi:Mn-dependent DtxR family transcriptional regulator